MLKIYHNPRCSKSREVLEFLKTLNENFEVIDYMKTGLSEDELKNIIFLLDIKPIELVRTNEPEWKELFRNKTLADNEIIKAMARHPKLIQRPIVVNGNKAVIGRPTEKIKRVL